MEIRTGATWVQPSGNTRTYDVMYTEIDGAELAGGATWALLGTHMKTLYLTLQADKMVVSYMRANNALSTEYAAERMGELNTQIASIVERATGVVVQDA